VPGFSFFKLVVPPLTKRGVTISDMRYLVPQLSTVGGNYAVSRFIRACGTRGIGPDIAIVDSKIEETFINHLFVPLFSNFNIYTFNNISIFD
jgi:hypothetical protein